MKRQQVNGHQHWLNPSHTHLKTCIAKQGLVNKKACQITQYKNYLDKKSVINKPKKTDVSFTS